MSRALRSWGGWLVRGLLAAVLVVSIWVGTLLLWGVPTQWQGLEPCMSLEHIEQLLGPPLSDSAKTGLVWEAGYPLVRFTLHVEPTATGMAGSVRITALVGVGYASADTLVMLRHMRFLR